MRALKASSGICVGFFHLTQPGLLLDARWVPLQNSVRLGLGVHWEVGAGSTIDAGTIRPTRIGSGTA